MRRPQAASRLVFLPQARKKMALGKEVSRGHGEPETQQLGSTDFRATTEMLALANRREKSQQRRERIATVMKRESMRRKTVHQCKRHEGSRRRLLVPEAVGSNCNRQEIETGKHLKVGGWFVSTSPEIGDGHAVQQAVNLLHTIIWR